MRPTLIFLAFLLVAAGCVVEDRPVNPGDGGVDAGECPPCPDSEKPVCNEDTCVECTQDSLELCGEDKPFCDDPGTFTCVECTEDSLELCGEDKPFCDDPGTFTCVECLTNADCKSPTLAKCDDMLKECVRCDDDRQCDNVEGFPGTENACNVETGECVDCTPESEETSCPGDPVWFVCDPDTNLCTDTPAGSRLVCESCTLDSECGDEDGMPSPAYRCVPMTYGDPAEPFPGDGTGFCLVSVELGGPCENPYRIVINRTSLSGSNADDYCGINEELATCPAVLSFLGDEDCDPSNGDEDCEQPAGLCRELPGMLNKCTYRCTSIVECALPGPTCGNSGPGGDDYCGG